VNPPELGIAEEQIKKVKRDRKGVRRTDFQRALRASRKRDSDY